MKQRKEKYDSYSETLLRRYSRHHLLDWTYLVTFFLIGHILSVSLLTTPFKKWYNILNPKAKELFMTDQYLQLLPVTADDMHPDTPNVQLLIALNERLNAQAERITDLLTDIEQNNPNKIGYADIMHWKSRATYLRNVGQAKAARELEKREALKEAKAADSDEEFMEGYQTFLATEFDTQS